MTAEKLISSQLAAAFEDSRSWLLSLIASLGEPALKIQVDELRGPLIWDLGHIAWFEELWIARNAFGQRPLRESNDLYYDNERNHKRTRQAMPLLSGDELFDYMRQVRQNSLSLLAQSNLDSEKPLLKNGFVFHLSLQHELQHYEIMMITLQQLLTTPVPIMDNSPSDATCCEGQSEYQIGAMATIPAAPFLMGADHDDFAYDNEKPAFAIDVPEFKIDRFLTTNAEYVEFIEAGGYETRALWSEAAWHWLKANQIVAPDYWRYDPALGWVRKGFGGRIEPLVADEPVVNVSAYEAEAYAKFRGKRLPSEIEWEKAAAFDPTKQSVRRYPWGDDGPNRQRAPLGCCHWGPCPVWAYPKGDSVFGVRQMLGNVFEWTASPFVPYRSFKAFPYKEYSEIFMNPQFRVLRGASWATHPLSTRNTYRNFYLPHHRNVIAGIRLAQ